MELSVGNTYSKHRSLHEYTRVARDQGGVEEGKEQDRSGAGEEGYAVLCEGCEARERNGSRTMWYCVKSG